MPVLGEGQIFERYRIIKWLGNGSAGESYEVEDKMLLRKATLKLIHPWTMLPDAARRQFFREMQGISVLAHRHLAPVLDYGEIDGRIYVARRYTSNGSLLGHNGRMWFKPPLTLASTFRYTYQLAQALQYIHLHGYTHGSLTFANILVLRGQNMEQADDFMPFLLADVGLSHFVRRFGKPGIEALPVSAAPEQINKRTLPASDQFALAVLVYFWLAGRPPYLGTPLEVEQQKRSETITTLTILNPGVTLEQDAIIRRALMVNPDKRHSSVLAFAEALMSTLPAEVPAQAMIATPVQTLVMPPVELPNPPLLPSEEPEPIVLQDEPVHPAELFRADRQDEPIYRPEQISKPVPEPHFNPITPLPFIAIDPITPIPLSPPQEMPLSLLERLSVGYIQPESNFPATTTIPSPPLTPHVFPQSFAFPVSDETAPTSEMPASPPPAPAPESAFSFLINDETLPTSESFSPLPLSPLEPESPSVFPISDETLPTSESFSPLPLSPLEPESPSVFPISDENEQVSETLLNTTDMHQNLHEQPALTAVVFSEESPVLAAELAETTLDLENIIEVQSDPAHEAGASAESNGTAKASQEAPQADLATPRLIISPPYSNSSYEFLLTSLDTNVGRAGASDLLLDQDNLTSRHHALIKRVDERVLIYDKRSNNGVFINGQRIEDQDGYELIDGDHISIGNYELIFRDTPVH